MTAKVAFPREFVPVPYYGMGVAGDVCRELISQYDTMELLVSHRPVKTRAGEPRTQEERFHDVYGVLEAHREEIFLTVSNHGTLLSGTDELLPVEKLMGEDDPEQSPSKSSMLLIFKDGTTLRFGKRHGIQIDDTVEAIQVGDEIAESRQHEVTMKSPK